MNTGQLKDITPNEIVAVVKELREKYIKDYVWDIVKGLEKMILTGQIEFKTPLTHDEYKGIIDALSKGDINAALSRGHISIQV